MNNTIEFGKEKIVNAKIKFAQTEIEENNKMVAQIGFELADNKVITTRINDFNIDLMKNILGILELRIWEELPRKYVRLSLEENRVKKIGNILNEKWLKI